MRLHNVILLLFVVSMLVSQGCSQGGAWFPKRNQSLHQQTYWDPKPVLSPHTAKHVKLHPTFYPSDIGFSIGKK